MAKLESIYTQTPIMGGIALLCILTKTHGFGNQINFEIIPWKIPMEDEEFTKEYREDADLNEIPIRNKKTYLKFHEAQQLVQNYQIMTYGDATKKTNSIRPFSDEMKKNL